MFLHAVLGLGFEFNGTFIEGGTAALNGAEAHAQLEVDEGMKQRLLTLPRAQTC